MIGKYIKSGLNRVWPSRVLVRGPADGGRIALTFDDGPHIENTAKILDILASRSLKATFFLQGNAVEGNPELVRSIDRAGHQLGNHGYSHYRCDDVSSAIYIADILRGQLVLEEVVGKSLPRIFRPPYGTVSIPTFLKLTGCGFQYVFWSFDSYDSFVRNADELLGQFQTRPVLAGDVLLLHEDYSLTVEALPRILDLLSADGHVFSRVSELRRAG